MLYAYRLEAGALRLMPPDADIADAIWIDLYRPDPAEAAQVEVLGVQVPSLADMEEIEISNRLYRQDEADFMTVVIPGQTPAGEQVSGPVTFILTPARLISVRHHDPRPFRTFPDRADRSSAGCSSPLRLYLGMVEEIVARLADHLEGCGRSLDDIAKTVYKGDASSQPDMLEDALEVIGQQGEVLARVRLGLLTMERMLATFSVWLGNRKDGALRNFVKAELRDLSALEVHADFLGNRVSLISDTTLGMINLAQNATVRIVSVVAALFLPPTLIASVYGMNFVNMGVLHDPWGYPKAIVLMLASAGVTYLYFKWKKWL
ncbi:MAG: magnesium transporter [Limimaricola sp.]|uniref:magnesium transporter CorA family protein n=1 Tax=Limimaricola sp. TaxID=2211665 RepID=UPI001D5A6C91|nr:magnesium transporter CorA family protein [Limimaricola sp.]MBI1416455.1 magnesium transporter [Limimaricola sp.]